MPTAEPLPTAGALPTAEPLPTMPVVPTATVAPNHGTSSDPIVGTWQYLDASDNLTTYSFFADNTFQRIDQDAANVYTGTWSGNGDGTYKLIYDMPTPGVATETITYFPMGSRMAANDTYFTRG
jgi:hypothetical protein